jgi:ATP-dependent exoDNAse (exonuclease V), alpha subunit - helicase superfamily I member
MTDVEFSLEQRNAIDLCCDTHTTIASVTGGAGVGKTLVMGEVYNELVDMKKSVALCAPTGRAAKRIEELTGIKALTVHRLLSFPMPYENQDKKLDPHLPRMNKENPLKHDVVIVDESSMISPSLYRFLIDALKKGAVIRWFGDNNQLPPVEEGKPPFLTLLRKHPKVELTYNYRSGDAIVSNAQRILRGQLPLRNERFEIIYSENPLMTMFEFVTEHFMQEDHQIIMPTRKGKAGTLRANPSLQVKFNSKGPMLRLDRFEKSEAPLTVRAGDKFIWIKNDYHLNLFNGEIGYIDWIDADAGDLGIVTGARSEQIPPRIKFYDPFVGTVLNYDPRKQIELGYAITTHKAQGSEFDTVVYCMSRSQMWLLNKRNFYTGITRAKKNVILITDRKAMGLSMRQYDV